MIDLRDHLSPEQLAETQAYFALRQRAWNEGWHHWQRIEASRNVIEPQQVHHCIPFEDNADEPVKVLHPSPRFISELMAGGIHPPIDAHHAQKLLLISKDGTSAVVTKLEASQWRKDHGPVEVEIVIDNRRAHLERERPLTYEQAIEYCVLKDVPHEVWGVRHNRPKFAIVSRTSLPQDRSHRNHWKLKDLVA